jgi:hypothetical protein
VMWVMREGWGGEEGEARERRMATSRVKEVRVRVFSFVVSLDLKEQKENNDRCVRSSLIECAREQT